MAKILKKSGFNLCMLVLALAGLALFFLQASSYATQLDTTAIDKPTAHAPEASSLVLLSTGIIGYIVRFARRRFQEFKRGFDIVVSLAGLVITSPLILAAAILIKIVSSKGSVFFKQERVGKDGTIFNILKLRTMKPNAEDKTGAVWAQENDARLLPVGKLLRKSHIDELPQLINVLKGEMSIVGPRPERPEFVTKLKMAIPDYEKRLAVNPGITGLAQVWHKYDETIADVKKKIKYDLLYIRKMCLIVDIRILFKTIGVVLTGQGAR